MPQGCSCTVLAHGSYSQEVQGFSSLAPTIGAKILREGGIIPVTSPHNSVSGIGAPLASPVPGYITAGAGALIMHP